MKKLIFGLVLASAAVAQAEYLLWTVEESDLSGSTLQAKDVAWMRVGYVKQNGSDEPLWKGTSLEVLATDKSSMGDTKVAFKASGEDSYLVNLSGLDNANYGFYIELLNNSGEIIGRTGSEATFTYDTYAQLSSGQHLTTGDIGSVPSVVTWHGGGFEAVPEPSSMALLALGAGLVGLRRKLKKGKKAQKGKCA